MQEKLGKVPDYRSGNAIRHNLTDILMIAVLTFLTNGTTYADICGNTRRGVEEISFASAWNTIAGYVLAHICEIETQGIKQCVARIYRGYKGNCNE